MQEHPYDKRVIIVCGEKGGVGKSLVSKLLWERIRSINPNARAFDADGSTGSLVRIYGAYDVNGDLLPEQPPTGVTPISLHGGSDDDRDEIAKVYKTGADVVLVDMPAISLTLMAQMNADFGFFGRIFKAGYQITMVTVVSPYRESLENVMTTFHLAPTAQNVVVLNLGDYDDFYLWHGDPRTVPPTPVSTGKQTLVSRNGVEISLPMCGGRALVVSSCETLTFSETVVSALLSDRGQGRLETFLDTAYDALSEAGGLLGLVAPPSSPKSASKPAPAASGSSPVSNGSTPGTTVSKAATRPAKAAKAPIAPSPAAEAAPAVEVAP